MAPATAIGPPALTASTPALSLMVDMRADRDSDLLAPYLALLEQKTPRPLTLLEMVRLLGVDRYDRKALRAGLERAVVSGQLRRIGKTRYQWRRDSDRTPTRGTSSP